MVVVGIRTKSGDFTRLDLESKTVADAEAQVMGLLKKTTPYITFKNSDGSEYTVKRTDIESFSVADLTEEELANDNEAD